MANFRSRYSTDFRNILLVYNLPEYGISVIIIFHETGYLLDGSAKTDAESRQNLPLLLPGAGAFIGYHKCSQAV